MHIPFLQDIVTIFGLSIIVLLIFNRLKIPALVGFLFTGVLTGPHGFSLVKAVEQVEVLAEVGVILLLFTIGIEFSFKNLFQLRKSFFVGGGFQVFVTILAGFLWALAMQKNLYEALFVGFLISLSSTAIVLKILQERAQVDTPHGRTSLAVLIFQDIIIVPMMILVPFLAGFSGTAEFPFLLIFAKGFAVIGILIVSAKWVLPNIMRQIARTQSRELFLLAIVLLCLSIAWLTSAAGLSLALGAFLAGLIISESEYSHNALSAILPFKDIFTSFFFVSVGMLLDINFLAHNLALALLIACGVFAVKGSIAAIATLILRLSLRTAVMVGLTLGQVGEFSFILAQSGLGYELLDRATYQLFLSVSVLTMAATPFVMLVSPKLGDAIAGLSPPPKKLRAKAKEEANSEKVALLDHLVIVGFGINGRNLAKAAKVAGIRYIIVEMNPDTVKEEKKKGEPIFYGDATYESVLKAIGIIRARVLVIAIPDAAATRKIVKLARELNPHLHIIPRTRFVQEMKPLYLLGANEVIPEEFETSVEIFTRVLKKYLTPQDEIEKLTAEIRAEGYELFRKLSPANTSFSDLELHLSDMEISTFRVMEGAQVAGRKLSEIHLRKTYGVTLLAIRRESGILSNPSGETEIRAGDILVIYGKQENIVTAAPLFAPNE
ncbi:MAG: cation:proton antiporter [Myxococcota bacterium]